MKKPRRHDFSHHFRYAPAPAVLAEKDAAENEEAVSAAPAALVSSAKQTAITKDLRRIVVTLGGTLGALALFYYVFTHTPLLDKLPF